MNKIHETAIVPPGLEIGQGNTIGPYCVIAPGTKIGDNNYFGPYCTIGMQAQIRNGAGTHPEGQVWIGNNGTFKGYCTIDSGIKGKTIISDGAYFMYYAHVGHDCVIGENVTLGVGVALGGHTIIEDDCFIGLGASVHQFAHIRKKTVVGMNAAVTKKAALEMKESQSWGGVPARLLGPNKKFLKS